MIKYNGALLICLMASATIFAGESDPNAKPLEASKKHELQKQESELRKATILMLKNKGKNGAAVDATWKQIEIVGDICDDIQDQLQSRYENE